MTQAPLEIVWTLSETPNQILDKAPPEQGCGTGGDKEGNKQERKEFHIGESLMIFQKF